MDPYEILGISHNATDSQIKVAYRKLVKQYHPDRNKNEDAHSRISEINQAYEILSDPQRRIQYDNPFQYFSYVVEEQQEDPVEVYKREFKRKRWEQEQAEKTRKLEVRKTTHRVMRMVTMPILLFAIVLVIDQFLPKKTIDEVAIGFPTSYARADSSAKNAIVYMQTTHFEFKVSRDLHLSYPYYEANKPLLRISYTPIFKVPRFVAVTINGDYNYFEVPDTIYSSFSNLWLLLIASLFTVAHNKHTDKSYSVSFAPIFLLAIVLMKLLA